VAHDSFGTKNQPQYAATGAPADAADLSELANYAALVGNRKVGTHSQRTALAGGDIWPGLRFFETDTLIEFLTEDGSAWKPWESDWITWVPTLTNLSVGTGGGATSSHQYRYIAGRVHLMGRMVLGTSGASVGAIPTVTLPVTRAALKVKYDALPGAVNFFDVSTDTPWLGAAASDGASTSAFRFFPVNSSVIGSAVGATNPFTFAAGDTIVYELSYEPA
jgi:hypothetical protein